MEKGGLGVNLIGRNEALGKWHRRFLRKPTLWHANMGAQQMDGM